MLQNVALQQGPYCLIRQNNLGTEVHLNLKIVPCDPLICIMNHPWFIVSNQMEEFISIQRGKSFKNVGTGYLYH